MPHDLTISDAEIDAVASHLGIDLSDEERRNVLRATRTCDIQACPGGGKTTLLVAKLFLLVDKWAWPDRGVCVLSHTNVARDEVERRLETRCNARRLVSYPHFIGTIQTFVDQFLALPQLRDEGILVAAVDDDRFGSTAFRCFDAPAYTTARNYFQNRGGIDGVVNRLTFKGHNLDVMCPGRSLPDSNTPTFKQLTRLKERLRDEGVFRYDDMYAYAERRIYLCPALIIAIRHRFPWVFIDEMQDTKPLQELLLQKLFADGVKLQRFGDPNQAIFGGGETHAGESSFPCQSADSVLTVRRSKRFGTRIALFASRLAVVQPETLEGRADLQESRHTVFTFDSNSVYNVLPAFGRLVLEEFDGNDLSKMTFKAVGFRKKPEESSTKKVAHSIGDYWPKFDPLVSTANRDFPRFIDYVRAGRQSLWQDGACARPYGTLLSAFLSLVNRAGAKTLDNKRFSRNTLAATLAGAGAQHEFCELLRVLCLSDTAPDEARWKTCTDRIVAVLTPVLQSQNVGNIGDFVAWRAANVALKSPDPESSSSRNNVFRYEQNGRAVGIEVTTIHAVKGETHTGTLLLETFWNKHDLGDACTWLADGAKRTKPKLGVERKERLKRLYVAATRATDLLCLAVHHDRLPSCLAEDLRKEGWSIVDVA